LLFVMHGSVSVANDVAVFTTNNVVAVLDTQNVVQTVLKYHYGF
jgi:hypothetical protein